MVRKLAITVSDDVYDALHRKIGRGRISHFLDNLAREHLVDRPTDAELGDYADATDLEIEPSDELERDEEAWLNSLIGGALGPRAAGER